MRVLAYEFATMGSLHDILHGINMLLHQLLCNGKVSLMYL